MSANNFYSLLSFLLFFWNGVLPERPCVAQLSSNTQDLKYQGKGVRVVRNCRFCFLVPFGRHFFV